MKIEAVEKDKSFPTVFNLLKSMDEKDKDDTWLRRELKHWCNFDAKKLYAGFHYPVISVRKVYMKPNFKVTFADGRTKIFIIHQTYN